MLIIDTKDNTHETSREDTLQVASTIAKDDKGEVLLNPQSMYPTRHANAFCAKIDTSLDFRLMERAR